MIALLCAGLKRWRGAAAVRAPATLCVYRVELRIGATTRWEIAASSEDPTLVAAHMRRVYGADVAYCRDGAGELVAFVTRAACL